MTTEKFTESLDDFFVDVAEGLLGEATTPAERELIRSAAASATDTADDAAVGASAGGSGVSVVSPMPQITPGQAVTIDLTDAPDLRLEIPPTPIEADRRWTRIMVAAAAALIVVVGTLLAFQRGDESSVRVTNPNPTPTAPTATVVATAPVATPLPLAIVVDATPTASPATAAPATAEPAVTPAPSATAVLKATPTYVPTSTAVPSPTATRVPAATPVPTAVPTVAVPAPTVMPTSTPQPATPVPTVQQPAATSTPVPVATSTPVPVATSTPTAVATATPVPVATSTPTAVATSTPVPVATSTPTATPVQATSVSCEVGVITVTAAVAAQMETQCNGVISLDASGCATTSGFFRLEPATASETPETLVQAEGTRLICSERVTPDGAPAPFDACPAGLQNVSLDELQILHLNCTQSRVDDNGCDFTVGLVTQEISDISVLQDPNSIFAIEIVWVGC